MYNLFKSLFLNNRFFYCLTVIALLFVIGFFVAIFFEIAKVLLIVLAALLVLDIFLLYQLKKGITIERTLPERLSNGDQNKISLIYKSFYKFPAHISGIEELPFQFQKRDFFFKLIIKDEKEKIMNYDLKPTKRGVYNFGHSNAYVSSPLQLATRKYVLGTPVTLNCYPSFLKMKDFDIKSFASNTMAYGTKKIRRIGHSLEFEQIKEYVSGDDIRTLNWKATAKANRLMVNQFVEEKSQSVYSVIDKGRAMQMSFEGLTLLDYAINATLAISNVVLKKQDKVGMLSFSKQLEDWVVAERRSSQMTLISDSLYNVKTDFFESDFSRLYAVVKRKITQRSLLIIYTNFETLDGLNRQLPYLRALAKNHLLLVVFFKNTELNKMLAPDNVSSTLGVYDAITAEQFVFEKKRIVNELKKYGIQSVLTKPQNLTGATINKYLDLKSRGLI